MEVVEEAMEDGGKEEGDGGEEDDATKQSVDGGEEFGGVGTHGIDGPHACEDH